MTKKSQKEVEEIELEQVIEPTPEMTEAQLNKSVRVQNIGAPFPCDLTSYGYGMSWPTNAVYTIPTRRYMELLEQGFNGSYV